jgi:sterol desaturase/sphingolipid hydroxylase (fatty acid hydroxylase superfamily)
MIDESLLIQIIFFISIAIIFSFFEFRRPALRINKKNHLLLNVMAMLIVIFAGEYAKKLVAAVYNAIHVSVILSGNLLGKLPSVPKIFLVILLSDFCLYLVHLTMHRTFKILWNAHVFHHTIPEIWWLSGSRTSLIHLLLFAVPQVFIAYYLFQLNIPETTFVLCVSMFVNFWIHSNFSVNLGPFQWLLITPDFHRLHHGSGRLIRSNLGFIFTFWDRLVRDLCKSKDCEKNDRTLRTQCRIEAFTENDAWNLRC